MGVEQVVIVVVFVVEGSSVRNSHLSCFSKPTVPDGSSDQFLVEPAKVVARAWNSFQLWSDTNVVAAYFTLLSTLDKVPLDPEGVLEDFVSIVTIRQSRYG